MKLTLVRHGDAHAGFSGPISGPAGCRGLTDLGRDQAALLRERMATEHVAPDVVLASELPRAIETADLVAPGFVSPVTIMIDCDLCEVHTGDADGTDWSDYGSTFGAFDMIEEPDRRFAPNGDSWNSFHERVEQFLQRSAEHFDGRHVVAFTSAGVIAAALRLQFGGPFRAGPRLIPLNTSLTQWDHDAVTDWTLRVYNDATHLDTV